MKNIVITGSTGFIGINLVNYLADKDYNLILFARNLEKAKSLFSEVNNISYIECDQCNFESCKKAILELKELDKEIHTIINLVGGGNVSSSSKEGFRELYEKNVTSCKILLDCILQSELKVGFFFHVSSISALGIQLNCVLDEKSAPKIKTSHEVVKSESEKIVKEYHEKYGLNYVMLRPGMVYGEWDLNSEIPNIVKMVKKGVFPLIGGGHGLLPWVYVGNLMQAMEAVLELSLENYNDCFLVCDPSPYKLREIVTVIAKSLGKKKGHIFLPKSLVKMGLFFLEPVYKLLNKEPPITNHRIESFSGVRRFNMHRAFSKLGYKPRYDLYNAMPKVVRWYVDKGVI